MHKKMYLVRKSPNLNKLRFTCDLFPCRQGGGEQMPPVYEQLKKIIKNKGRLFLNYDLITAIIYWYDNVFKPGRVKSFVEGC